MPSAIAFILLLSACAPTSLPPSGSEPEIHTSNSEILRTINRIRETGGYCGNQYAAAAPLLQWDAKLEAAAQRHADDMYKEDFFDHKGSDGSYVKQRVNKTGFDWRHLGENIAYGYNSADQAITSWKDSPGHCKNLLSGDFDKVAVANRGPYWVMVLAGSSQN